MSTTEVPPASDGLAWRARYEGAAGKPLTVPGGEAHYEAGQRSTSRPWPTWGHGVVDYGNWQEKPL